MILGGIFQSKSDIGAPNHILFSRVILRRRQINPFQANVPILYPLKTPENLWCFGVFRGYKMRALARNGLGVQESLHNIIPLYE